MTRKVVTLTLSVDAETDGEAWEAFEKRLMDGDYDSDSIEIEDDGDEQ
jgi:hypothetical protein